MGTSIEHDKAVVWKIVKWILIIVCCLWIASCVLPIGCLGMMG